MILISFYLSAAWVSTICVLYSHFLSLLELLLMWLNLRGVPPFRDTPLDKSWGCPDTRTPPGSPPLIFSEDLLKIVKFYAYFHSAKILSLPLLFRVRVGFIFTKDNQIQCFPANLYWKNCGKFKVQTGHSVTVIFSPTSLLSHWLNSSNSHFCTILFWVNVGA